MALAIDWSETPTPNLKLRELVKRWFSANASEHPATATRQRQMARTLVEAIEVDGLDYEKLPADFLAKHWFPKHGGAHRVTQNVMIALAAKVIAFFRAEGIKVPEQVPPKLAEAPSRVKLVAVPPPESAAPEAASPAPVAPAAPRPPRARPAPTPVHVNHPLPPLGAEEPPMPVSAFAFPEPPANDARRGKVPNPVAAIIAPENRLRIYRRGEPGQPDAHLIDIPAAQVARFGTGAGAVITILNDVVRPKWGPRPGERITYRLVQVSPQSVEGNAIERDLEGETLPMAPVAPPAPLVPAVAMPMGVDQLEAVQRLQLQLAQLEQQQRGPAPVDAQAFDTGLRSLQEQIEQLKAQLSGLATKPAGPGDFGTAALGAMTGMVDKMLANKPPAPDKQPSFMDAFALAQQQADRQLAQQKQLFELVLQRDKPPAVDPGLAALLERMDARLAALEAREEEDDDEPADDGLSGIKKFMETAEFLKKNMGIEAGPTMRAKEPENMLGLFRELLTKAPEIIAEYRQTIPVVAAARLGMVETVQVPVGPDGQPVKQIAGGQAPAQQQPAQGPMTPEQQRAAVRARLPEDVRAAIERLLNAGTDDQVADSVGALVNLLTKHAAGNPQALSTFNALEADVLAGNLENTVMRLRQIFTFFGYSAEAPVPKVTAMAKTIIRLVKDMNDRKPAEAPAPEQAAPAPAVAPAPAAPAAESKPAEPAEEADGEDTDEGEEDDGELEDDESDEDEEEGDEGDEEGDVEEDSAPAAAPVAANTAPAVEPSLDPSDL